MIKVIDKQLDEEIYRGRSERILSVGISVPVVKVCYPPDISMRSPIWKLSESYTFRFLKKLHYVGMIYH